MKDPRHTLPSSLVAYLRRLSGLSCAELDDLLYLPSHTIAGWISGAKIPDYLFAQLAYLLDMIQYIDRGSAGENRDALLQSLDDGTTVYERIKEGGSFGSIKRLLGRGPGRKIVDPARLSREALEARRPLSPAELVGARHDPIYTSPGKSRGVRAKKCRKE